MKNLIIIFACLVAGVAHAKTGDSTSNVVELLPVKKISYSYITLSENGNCIRIVAPRQIISINYIRNLDLLSRVGTRNMNYYTNFASGSSSIGYDEPHFGGARADGNAIFLDGVRLLTNSPLGSGILSFK